MSATNIFPIKGDAVLVQEDDGLEMILSDALASLRQQSGLTGVFVMEPRMSGRRVFKEEGEIGEEEASEYDHLPMVGTHPSDKKGVVRRLAVSSRSQSQAKKKHREIISIPVLFSGGDLCGTFHCESGDEGFGEINDDSLSAARVLASFIGRQIERTIAGVDAYSQARELIQSVIDNGDFDIVYQPIVVTNNGEVIGHECLTRFRAIPYQSPDKWFDMALAVGMQAELEMAVIHKALEVLPSIGGYLSVNISPSTILQRDLAKEFEGLPLDRMVLEITEHSAIDNYEEIEEALSGLRGQGLHLAIDDAGSGYASLRHILMLKPDMVKIDQSITRDIDSDSGRQAMAGAFRGFAARIGCSLVAEGVESKSERDALEFLGIPHCQGYHFSKPLSLETLLPDTDQATA